MEREKAGKESLKDRVVRELTIEVKSIWDVFNREKVKEALEGVLEETGLEVEEDKKPVYEARFRTLLKRIEMGKSPRRLNFAGAFFGGFWGSYRNRLWGSLYLYTLAVSLQLFLLLMGESLLGIMKSIPLTALVYLLVLFFVTFIPYFFFGLYGDAYLAITAYKGLPITRSWKKVGLYVLFSLLIAVVLDLALGL